MTAPIRMRLTYYPDITQGQPDERVRAEVVVFANALAQQLSDDLGTAIEIDVPPVLEVPQQFDDMVGGHSAFGLLKPVTYIFAHQVDERIVPACVALRPINGVVGEFYYGQVYARRDTGLTKITDLTPDRAGTLRIAYGDRFSTSNFLVPAYLMQRDAGLHPFLYFKEILFTGGHDLAAEAVYEGRADIGCGHDGAITILGETRPDAADVLVQLGHENIHSDPVVVNTGVLPAPVTLEAVQQACVAIAATEPVKQSLDIFWGWVKGLAPTTHADYASIEEALAALHLGEADMR